MCVCVWGGRRQRRSSSRPTASGNTSPSIGWLTRCRFQRPSWRSSSSPGQLEVCVDPLFCPCDGFLACPLPCPVAVLLILSRVLPCVCVCVWSHSDGWCRCLQVFSLPSPAHPCRSTPRTGEGSGMVQSSVPEGSEQHVWEDLRWTASHAGDVCLSRVHVRWEL